MVSKQDVKRAMAMLGTGANYGYFFDEINSPDWIEPLKVEGFFQNPPVITGDGRSRPWPESRYLVRMAEKAPALVVSVLLEMSETENALVQTDIIRAAINMPANQSARLVDRVSRYSKGWGGRWHSDDLSKLASKLVTEGQVQYGIRLFAEILQLEAPDEEKDRFFREVKTHIDMYHYGEVIKSLNMACAGVAPLEGIKLLRDLLIKAIRLNRRSDTSDREDLMHISVPDVQDDSKSDWNVRCSLLSGLRRLSEVVVENDPDMKGDILSLLHDQPFVVFDRLQLHLLAKYPEGQEVRISELLQNKDLFERASSCKEYRKLLKKMFGNLDEVRNKYLEWLDEEPNVKAEKERLKELLGQDVPEEDIKRSWRRDKLGKLDGLTSFLPPEWQKEYDKLVSEFGDPRELEAKEADFMARGPRQSPKSAQELQQMSVDEVFVLLREWRAPEPWEWGKCCPAGLADELAHCLEHRLKEFCDKSDSFREVDSTYVRTFLRVVARKRKEMPDYDWSGIIRLCKWVAERPMTLQEWRQDKDSGWSGAQNAMIDLIQEGLTEGAGGIRFEFRQEIWACLEPLTRSPDPTKERELKSMEDNSNYEPINLAINSVRGNAIQAVFKYAWWVKRQVSPEKALNDFDGIEEVRNVLDEHLNIEKEPLLAIRAIYGEWLPHLTVLGEQWSASNKDAIFPTQQSDLEDYMRAAWNTYIQSCNVYDNVFNLIRDKYEWAIVHIAQGNGGRERTNNVDINLGRHLIVVYARGVLKKDQNLWIRFWREAPKRIRKDAIEFCGRLLMSPENPTPPAALERLKNLLDDRIKFLNETEQDADELASFGWWFESNELADEWLLSHLIEVLKLTKGQLEWEHKVLERIAQMLPDKALEVLGVLEKIAGGDIEGWVLVSNKDRYRGILQEAVRHESEEVQERAIELVNYLGAMGYQEFGELLD